MIPNGDKGSARQSSSSLVLWSVGGSQGVSLHVVKSVGEDVKPRWNEVNNETYINIYIYRYLYIQVPIYI